MVGHELAILEALWRTSWQVSLLFAGVLCLEWILGARLTARWRYRLWLLVLLRLAVPAPVTTDGALVPWRALEGELAPRVASVRPLPALGLRPTGEPAVAPIPAAADPRPPLGDRASTAGAQRSGRAALATAPPAELAGPAVSRAIEPPRSTASIDGPRALVILWAAGVAVALLRLAVGARSLRRRLARASSAVDPRIAAALERCTAALGLRHPPVVRALDELNGPAVFGVRRPVLLVPTDLADRVASDELERVLLHELFHVRSRDVAINLAAAIGTAVFWFHPLVHLARARLRTAQESARDWQALEASSNDSTDAYARALVDLAQGRRSPVPTTALPLSRAGRDLQRRILMIANYSHRPRRAWVVGAPLVAALGWIGFTDAAVPPTPMLDPSGTDWSTIAVQRVQQPPDWVGPIDARLDRSLPAIEFDGEPSVSDLLDHLRTVLDANVVVHPNLHYELGIADAPPLRAGTTGRGVLDAIVALPDIPQCMWCLASGSILIAEPWAAPEAFDLRLYNVSPLVDKGFDLDDVADFVRTMSCGVDEAWDYEHAGMHEVGYTLAIKQTDVVHRAIHAALERLLNDGQRPPGYTPPVALLDQVANQSVPIAFENADLGEVADWLAATLDVPVRVDGSIGNFPPVTMHLSGTSARDSIALIARTHDLDVYEEDGAIVFGEEPGGAIELELYPLAPLARSLHAIYADDESEPMDWSLAADWIDELVGTHVSPRYWELEPESQVRQLGPFMVVFASAPIQAEVARLIRTLEVATR